MKRTVIRVALVVAGLVVVPGREVVRVVGVAVDLGLAALGIRFGDVQVELDRGQLELQTQVPVFRRQPAKVNLDQAASAPLRRHCPT